jgi:hydrogenase maturation protein HypF
LTQRQRIDITGRVQGVGFRPAVYRLAGELGLSGYVLNDTKGVTVELQGEPENIDRFVDRLQSGPDKPPLAQIQSCRRVEVAPVEGEAGFTIRSSTSRGTALSQVTADVATCRDCLAELNDPADFRRRYPFINCTNCGPRYSIVKTIPYDRPNTTMSAFAMCGRCGAQYRDPTDRRFHAQPVACARCGPKIWLADAAGQTVQASTDEVVATAASLLREGNIVAIKGIGGFHLACDALNDEAVRRLRKRKRRDHKPFALMAASVGDAARYAVVDRAAEALLTSPESPIVLLPKRPGNDIAASVAEGVSTFGLVLCYAPLHHLLFAEGLDVLVMTSANISDEPLICRNDKALERLGDVADAFLMHDREIYRQVDDSIVHTVAGAPALLRRARGYVPTPIGMTDSAPTDILAAGSDLKNTFCFIKQNQLILSEHIGDLEDAEVYHHYVDSIGHLAGLFEVEPRVVACDLHPGYLSTQYARSLPGVRLIEVQHHWAHIASVLAEHGHAGPVIGLECDGTGYGTDGAIWGCECLLASLTAFERFAHLAYYPLPGGDKASKEAIRPVLSLLRAAYGETFDLGALEWLLKRIDPDPRRRAQINEQIEKGVNCVATSSLGRVFDAVAALLGLGTYNHFDAQLPMALEAIAIADCNDSYGFEVKRADNEPLLLDLRSTVRELVGDVAAKLDRGLISTKFHNTLAEALLSLALAARQKTQLNVVALGGGVFCNRYLTDHLARRLQNEDFEVLLNRDVPANDGGLALGQAVIAAHIIKQDS